MRFLRADLRFDSSFQIFSPFSKVRILLALDLRVSRVLFSFFFSKCPIESDFYSNFSVARGWFLLKFPKFPRTNRTNPFGIRFHCSSMIVIRYSGRRFGTGAKSNGFPGETLEARSVLLARRGAWPARAEKWRLRRATCSARQIRGGLSDVKVAGGRSTVNYAQFSWDLFSQGVALAAPSDRFLWDYAWMIKAPDAVPCIARAFQSFFSFFPPPMTRGNLSLFTCFVHPKKEKERGRERKLRKEGILKLIIIVISLFYRFARKQATLSFQLNFNNSWINRRQASIFQTISL